MANPPPKIRWAVFLGIALLALAVRLPSLGERPMHTDEAVNGYITGQLLAGEGYQYDPQDRHGPTLYLAALPIVRAAGARNLADLTEVSVRLVPVIFSVLTVLLFAVFSRTIGFVAAVFAALLFSVAPLPVYYARYFIHESLFVAGTLGFILAGWQTLERKSVLAATAAGACAAFMLACKETALLHYGAFSVAGIWWLLVGRSEVTRRSSRWSLLVKPLVAALIAFGVLTLVLYTWGFRNWQGPIDLLRSIPRFAARAGGEGHEKPFWYYAGLLAGGGHGWVMLALAFLAAGLNFRSMLTSGAFSWRVKIAIPLQPQNPQFSIRMRRLPLELLTIYTLTVSLVYSVIPYKNPWLGLNLWVPLALLAGIGFQWLWLCTARIPVRLGMTVAGSFLLLAAMLETRQWVYHKSSDEKNPYAYAHTVEDILGLPPRVAQLLHTTPANPAAEIAVIAADPWPLPWYLRKFSRVGYYQPGQEPAAGSLYLTSLEAAASLENRLANWRPEFFGVRPEVLILLWSPPPAPVANE